MASIVTRIERHNGSVSTFENEYDTDRRAELTFKVMLAQAELEAYDKGTRFYYDPSHNNPDKFNYDHVDIHGNVTSIWYVSLKF